LILKKIHLKDYSSRKPPYGWNDFKERLEDEAVNRIAFGGDEHTICCWGLASLQDSYYNWIAQ